MGIDILKCGQLFLLFSDMVITPESSRDQQNTTPVVGLTYTSRLTIPDSTLNVSPSSCGKL